MYVALLSAKSAGVTTAAAAMAATAPHQGAALAIELDPSGGDIACWTTGATDLGLLGFADLVRRGDDVMSVFNERSSRDAAWITAPTNGASTEAALRSALPRVGSALASCPTLLLGDLGRWASSQPTASRLDGADLAVIVMRATPSSIEHARHLASSLTTANAMTVGLVIGDLSYAADEIEPALGCRVIARLPWDPPAIDALFREGPASRRFARSRLAAAAGRALDEVVELLEVRHVA